MVLLEVFHSKFGQVQVELRPELDCKYPQMNYYWPDGEFMGGMDEEAGGGLEHPLQRGLYGGDFIDQDWNGYVELENLLMAAVEVHYPNFFKKMERIKL